MAEELVLLGVARRRFFEKVAIELAPRLDIPLAVLIKEFQQREKRARPGRRPESTMKVFC